LHRLILLACQISCNISVTSVLKTHSLLWTFHTNAWGLGGSNVSCLLGLSPIIVKGMRLRFRGLGLFVSHHIAIQTLESVFFPPPYCPHAADEACHRSYSITTTCPLPCMVPYIILNFVLTKLATDVHCLPHNTIWQQRF